MSVLGKLSIPVKVLAVILASWAFLVSSTLLDQRAQADRLAAALGNRPLAARQVALDDPAYRVARSIAGVVPEDGCVTVIAYAGPAAVDYYDPRFDYLLYPRRSRVVADSSANTEDCEYLAVFRDTQRNLASEPFRGQWDQQALDARLAELEEIRDEDGVAVYRRDQ